jgi:ribosomal protein S18 acetylase RimI-like enzyme
MQISEFQDSQTKDVVALWQRCGLTRPWNDPYKDILRKQTDKNGKFFVGHDASKLIATIMVGYDGHRGSINYLAVDPAVAGKGHGRALMQTAEAFLLSLECPKINLCVRRDNEAVIKFYDDLGYQEESVYYCGKRLIEEQ